jgi:hypothetical protein
VPWSGQYPFGFLFARKILLVVAVCARTRVTSVPGRDGGQAGIGGGPQESVVVADKGIQFRREHTRSREMDGVE